jgi:hypothetical protein
MILYVILGCQNPLEIFFYSILGGLNLSLGRGTGTVALRAGPTSVHSSSVLHLAQTRALVHSGPNGVFEDESPLSSRPPRSITFVLPPNDKGTTSSGIDRSGLSVSPPLEGLVDYRDWMQVAVRLDRLHIFQNLIARWYWEREASAQPQFCFGDGSMAVSYCP